MREYSSLGQGMNHASDVIATAGGVNTGAAVQSCRALDGTFRVGSENGWNQPYAGFGGMKTGFAISDCRAFASSFLTGSPHATSQLTGGADGTNTGLTTDWYCQRFDIV